MAKRFGSKMKSSALTIVSGVAFLVIIWFLFYGKVKAANILAPILSRLPKNEAELVKTTEGVLGAAIEKIKGGQTLKKAAEKGSEFFEQSDYTQPARDIRESIKQKIDQAVDSAKQLPEQELILIKRQVCKEWFENEGTATGSGGK